MTKTAVVILNWNGEQLLPEYLPSVIKNTTAKDAEIIVVDNKSTDRSVQVLQEQFPQVRTLVLEENYGFALGYNVALKQIDAEYYVLLNSDVEVAPGWLEPIEVVLDKQADVAAVQPKILDHKKPTHFEYGGAAGGMLDKLGYPYCRGRVLNNIEADKGQYNQSEDIFWASGACLAIRSECYHQMQGFDADFWAHMEEIDLCWRLKNAGWRIVYEPKSVVYHLGGGSLAYDNPKKLYLNFRNNLYMLYKNTPTSVLWLVIPTRLLLDGLAALKLLLEKNTAGIKGVWNAHMAFYKHIGKLSKKRKASKKHGKAKWHPEMEHASILFQHYLRGKGKIREE